MADEMGSDREALVNEAMYAFARQHGQLGPAVPPPAATPHEEGERRSVTERVLETAERLERDIAATPAPAPGPPPIPAARPDAPGLPGAGPRPGVLWLRREDGSVVEVDRDRFVVGRGAHCDLIIDSAKISREHAVFLRDAEGWWIEDLGSSNGTWYRGERVKRRRVLHGDEFFLCAEKFRCALH
jgi:pSer/pThr/pTyr-binding forkhead associated (FHA) protein